MEILHRVDLRIAPTDDVRPHERADLARQERIKNRLRHDGVLRDPVIVGAVPDVDGYVLLDGTNRKGALADLGFPFILIQTVDYVDQHAVALRTWCHAVAGRAREIVPGVEQISGVSLSRLAPLEVTETLHDPLTLAVLLDGSERWAIIRHTGQGAGRAAQLRDLVDLYETRLTRIDCDPGEVEEHAQAQVHASSHPSTLVAFPPFSRSQVVCMAMEKTPIPAGITRHTILSGRALRVNLPLDVLDGSLSLDRANAALKQHLDGLRPRLYHEPTVLFDS